MIPGQTNGALSTPGRPPFGRAMGVLLACVAAFAAGAPHASAAGPQFASPEELGRGYDVSIAVNDVGVAVAAWRGQRGVKAAVRGPNGRWSRPHRLGGPGTPPDVAVDPSGRAVVVWARQSAPGAARISAARYRPQSGWAPSLTVARMGPVPNATAFRTLRALPVVAVDAGGAAVAAWSHLAEIGKDGERHAISLASMSADGDWAPPEELDRTKAADQRVELAVSADGYAAAAWRDVEAKGDPADRRAIRVASRPPGGRFTTRLATTGAPAVAYKSPRIGVAPGGLTTVAWVRITGAPATNEQLQVAQRPAGQSDSAFSPVTLHVLSGSPKAPGRLRPQAVLTTDAGTATVAWTKQTDTPQRRVTAHTSSGAPGRRWAAPSTIFDSPVPVEPLGSALQLGPVASTADGSLLAFTYRFRSARRNATQISAVWLAPGAATWSAPTQIFTRRPGRECEVVTAAMALSGRGVIAWKCERRTGTRIESRIVARGFTQANPT